MKIQYLVFVTLFLSAGHIFGQNQQLKEVEDQAGMLVDLFEPDSRTNMTIIAHTNCPPQYTNVISNTNLFTPSEQTLLREIFSKYKNVTTNSGPAGTMLTGLGKTNGCYVAYFSYTNSDAREVVTFGNRPSDTNYGGGYSVYLANLGGTLLAKYRISDDSGYDVMLGQPDFNGVSTIAFAQIKQGKVNGLFVDFSNDHCAGLLRFENGKAVGEWLQWDTYTDNHLLEVKIKSSLDYFKYMTQEVKN